MSTPPNARDDSYRVHDRRANLTGAYVTVVGVAIFVISIFLDWASSDDDGTEATEGTVDTAGTSYNGYEADSLLPFAAFLGIGFAVALLYAASLAYRRQHRGLTLASMAVGAAVTIFSLAWVFNVPGAAERSTELGADIGTYVGILGALLWFIGSTMLAREPEGDDHDDHGTTTTGRSRA